MPDDGDIILWSLTEQHMSLPEFDSSYLMTEFFFHLESSCVCVEGRGAGVCVEYKHTGNGNSFGVAIVTAVFESQKCPACGVLILHKKIRHLIMCALGSHTVMSPFTVPVFKEGTASVF